LLRIASNLIADRAKKVAREDQSDATELADPAGSGQAQQTDLEAAERRAYVIRLVDELPEDQRRVVRMRFAEEKSIGEIAAQLNRTEGAVKQLQFRAFQTLRARLDTK
jgi:RNA polymerase sigma-70 factor (ECF subfamily)